MKVGIVAQEVNGVSYHRLIKPFSLLSEDFELVHCEGANSDMFDYGFDVIIFSRILPVIKQGKFIRELQKRGVYVICDIDDHWLLNTGHIGKKAGDKFRTQSIEALKYSDEVWVTHRHLGQAVNNLNANWYVIPNALDPTDDQWKPKENYERKIGWAGGITHVDDLMLTKGCYSRPPVICGWQNESEWLKLKKSFPAQYVKGLGVSDYGNLYNYFDIAIAPLVGNKFNTYKSNLKILEAGIKGIPIFVSNQHPYTDEHKGIFKVNDWQKAVTKAESMGVEEIRENGLALRSYVLERYDIREVNKRRVKRL